MEEVLQIKVEEQEQSLILKLSGRLDGLGARQLEEMLTEKITLEKYQIFLDMQEVRFLSSAGIRVLVKYYKICHEHSGDFSLGNVPDQIINVLKMVGLEQLILNTQEKQNPINPEKKCKAFENLTLEHWQLHNEKAEISTFGIPSLPSTPQPLSLQPYTTLLGQGYYSSSHSQTSPQLKEFMAIDEVMIKQTRYDHLDTSLQSAYHASIIGSPSDQLHFFCPTGKSVRFSKLIRHCMEMIEATSAGIIAIAHTTGITAASSTPTLKFTGYPSFSNHTTLIAGITHQDPKAKYAFFTRPIANDMPWLGHFHAAIYPNYHIHEEKPILTDTIKTLISNPSLGVFHLLNDNRPETGYGESRFSKGFIWMMKIK